MLERTHVIVAIVCFGVVSILFILVLWRKYFHKSDKEILDQTSTTRTERLQSGIIKLHQQEGLHHHNHNHHQVEFDNRRMGNYYMFRRGVSGKPLFSWSDHPSLITDAVENGWSRFAFTGYMSSSPSTRSRLLGLCTVGDLKREVEPKTSWEICQESADFMQKIRLNPGLKKALNAGNSSMAAASVIRTALPLPGPPLGNSSFPQEAYFEITILFCQSRDEINQSIGRKVKEGEKTKLIQENSNAKANSESLLHVTSSNRVNNKIEDLKVVAGRDDGKGDAVMLSVGLTAGGSLPLKLPGSYSGSIGFNSDGSVYVDGNCFNSLL